MAWEARPALSDTGRPTVPMMWRTFLRALAVEVDGRAGAEGSAAMLRAAGQRMAAMQTLMAVDSLEALELEMNAVLADIGWGSVRVALNEADRCVVLSHSGLPRIGSAGDPPGAWLAPVLEGLYYGWMGQQAGADPSFTARIKAAEGDAIIIRYGR